MRTRRGFDRRQIGNVVRDDQAGDSALVHGDSDRAIHEMTHLLRRGRHLDVLVRDILEQGRQIDLLLIGAAERRARLLPHDRDDRLMVELGVVEAVQQMDRARPRSRQADPDLARELGVRTRHERRHLLVAHLNQLRIAAGTVERSEDRVDAVAWIAVDAVNVPFTEPLQKKIAHPLSHRALLICGRTCAKW